jgi:O-glycosyl hydrolase
VGGFVTLECALIGLRGGNRVFVTKALSWPTLAAIALTMVARSSGAAIVANPSVKHQTMDGFGASSATFVGEQRPNWSSAQADQFFSASSGLGLSLLRIKMQPDGTTDDLSVAQQAVARGVRVWAVPWTPPAAWKSNHSIHGVEGGVVGYLCHGVNNPASGCTADHYADWANQLAQFVVNMAAAGVPLYAIAIQNEPSYAPDYEGCVYTESELHTFIPYLSSALIAAGVGSTKIALPEDTGWNSLNYTVMNDPTTAAMVGIVTNHGYSTSSISPLPSGYQQGKPAWQTEYATIGGAYDGSIGNGVEWATSIHNYVVNANANAWHYWQSLWPRAWGAPADNQALTDANGNMAKRGYALGQWGKFVRPGYQRIDVTNSTSVLVSAFAHPTSHNWVVVAVNSSGSASTQTFSVTGAQASTAVPWVTSSTLSLAQQSAVAVSNGTFSYTLPANSIVSFVGIESTGGTPTRTTALVPTATPTRTSATTPTSAPSSATPTATPEKTKRGAPNATLSPEAINGFEKYPPKVQRLLTSALELTTRNLDYQYGSADPANGGMDCSGFVYFVLKQNGIDDVPRDSSEQYVWLRHAGKFEPVVSQKEDSFEFDDLKPGDLLFWTGTYAIQRDPPITHAMIYVGREKKTGMRVMVGASDGRTYQSQQRFGVSVFDFKMPRADNGEIENGKTRPRFVGYAHIPGL